MKKPFYQVTRDLHLYFGLFITPFLMVFALSTIVLNHRLEPDRQTTVSKALVNLNQATKPVDQAREVMQQLGLVGELKGAFHVPAAHRLQFTVARPGEQTSVRIDLETHEAEVERRQGGFWDSTIYLHMNPGPHRPRSQTNWIFSKIWNWLADTTVYLLIFLSVSGIYLWAVLKAERKPGLIFFGLGALTFFFVIFGFSSASSFP